MREQTLKSIVLGTILAISLTGCKQCKTEYSDVKTETAIVSEKYHRNAYSYPMRVGKTTTIHRVPAVNRVSFDGGVDFQVNDRGLYDAFNEGDSAIVKYKDVYHAVYADKNKDGTHELISRELCGHDLVDVSKKYGY